MGFYVEVRSARSGPGVEAAIGRKRYPKHINRYTRNGSTAVRGAIPVLFRAYPNVNKVYPKKALSLFPHGPKFPGAGLQVRQVSFGMFDFQPCREPDACRFAIGHFSRKIASAVCTCTVIPGLSGFRRKSRIPRLDTLTMCAATGALEASAGDSQPSCPRGFAAPPGGPCLAYRLRGGLSESYRPRASAAWF